MAVEKPNCYNYYDYSLQIITIEVNRSMNQSEFPAVPFWTKHGKNLGCKVGSVLVLHAFHCLNLCSKIFKPINKRSNRPLIFIVVCLVAWPLNENESGVDLVLIET